MRGTVFSRLRLGATKLLRDQRGNAFMLTAAAIVPVIGIVGSAVDIGRAYMTQLRLQQACDSAVLAGRRAMASGTYSDAAKAEASKMFNFNFPEERYGSTGISFSSQSVNASDVDGSASAILPTALMYIFGKDEFRLSAACTAKLEISNVDVMMVLDVTGSMARKADDDDDDTKIVALQNAAIDFFDTLTSADVGDGRLRFGVVPYSSSVNVGGLLIAKNADWIANSDLLPSRTPVFKYINPETSTEPTYVESAQTTDSSWTNDGTDSADTKAKCEALSKPADTSPSPDGSPNFNQTARYEDGNGKRTTTYNQVQKYVFRTFRYSWSSSKCRKQYKNVRFTRTYVTTTVDYKSDEFDDKYIYEDRNFDVTAVKTGDPLETDTGDEGDSASISWGGCIIERATTPFAANETAPSDAYDMDIDMVPTTAGDDAVDTQWKMFLPGVTFPRSTQASQSSNDNDKDNFVEMGGDYAACPVAAMNLTTMTSDDLDDFSGYIATLQPRGYTYHDAGMAWGARLISPTGLFTTENAPPINGRPVSRHIVFMTDGEMNTPRANLSHQGHERSMGRIGATGDDNAIARHNNRFVQLCRAARARGVTVWVVSFGVGANTNLNSCASSGQAFEASNAAQLNEQFQAIARQISKLRLSQ
ncbi:pilus assembly protein [Sphingopyxis sp.]|uniref:TadE/TadG family type IV pilus assembly protein n=1 Tax=Sphingopyxis sp. TaxID=1908224 RepID=UPI003D6D7538